MDLIEKSAWNRAWDSVLVRLGIRKVPGVAASLGDTLSDMDTAIALAGSTTADTTLYVDQATGSDSNTGLVGFPLLTIQAAIDKVPRTLKHNVTVNVGPGTYAESVRIPEIIVSGLNKGLTLIGTSWTQAVPATGPATGVFTANDGIHSLTLAAAGWTVSDLRGKMLKITSGAKNGSYYGIAGNTIDTITVGGLASEIGNASFEVCYPAASVTFGVGDTYSVYIGNGFGIMSGNFLSPIARISGLNLTRVFLDSRSVVTNCRIQSSSTSVQTPNHGALDVYLLNSYISTSSASSSAISLSGRGSLVDSVVDCLAAANQGGAGVFVNIRSQVNLSYGLYIQNFQGTYGCGFNMSQDSVGLFSAEKVTINNCRYGIRGGRWAIPYQLASSSLYITNCISHGVWNDAYGGINFGSKVIISGCGGNAFDINFGGCFIAPSGASSITGNTGFGIKLAASNAVTHNNIQIGSTVTMNTNALGDLTLDGTTPITIADLRAEPTKTMVDLARLNRLAAD